VDPLYLEAYDAFMEVASGVRRTGYTETVPPLEGEGDIATVNREARPDPALLGLLNVRYVAAEFPMAVEGLREVERFGSTYLYENEQVLPRAFVVGQVEPVEGFDAALEWAQTHNVARTAAVESGRPLASGQVQAEVAWVRRSPNQLVLDVTRIFGFEPGVVSRVAGGGGWATGHTVASLWCVERRLPGAGVPRGRVYLLAVEIRLG
jgi:hypothetical protein